MCDLGLGVSSPSAAPTDAIRRTTLSGGLTVVTENVPGARAAGLVALIDAGPSDDPEDKQGLAHFCEHAMFLGAGERTEIDVARLIDTAGGQCNAFTTRDYTAVTANVAGDNVTIALDLMGDLISDPRGGDRRLESEREVIAAELETHFADPAEHLDQSIKRLHWSGPLGRPILGTAETLAAIRPADVRRFFESHYTADRVTVAAAGDVDHDAVVDMVRDGFWTLRPGTGRERAGDAAPRRGVVVRPQPIGRPLVQISLPCPRYDSPDRYAHHVLSALIGGGLSSRMYRTLRGQTPLAYDAGSALHTYGTAGVLNLSARPAVGDVMATVMKTVEILVDLAGGATIDDEEVWLGRSQVRGQAFLASDMISTRASRLATQQFYFGRPLKTDAILAGIEAVTTDDVRRAAADIIAGGLSRMVIGVAGEFDAVAADRLRSDLDDLIDCFG